MTAIEFIKTKVKTFDRYGSAVRIQPANLLIDWLEEYAQMKMKEQKPNEGADKDH